MTTFGHLADQPLVHPHIQNKATTSCSAFWDEPVMGAIIFSRAPDRSRVPVSSGIEGVTLINTPVIKRWGQYFDAMPTRDFIWKLCDDHAVRFANGVHYFKAYDKYVEGIPHVGAYHAVIQRSDYVAAVEVNLCKAPWGSSNI